MWLLRFQNAATAVLFFAGGGARDWIASAQVDTEVVPTECSTSDLIGYDYKVEPEPGLSIHWNLLTRDISLKAVSTNFEVGWLSIGFSADGNMIGSDAVVGSVAEQEVLEYELGAKALPVQPPSSPVEGSIRLFSDDEQEISAGVYENVDNVTSLSFTRPLTPVVDVKVALLDGAGNTTILLWAAGPDDAFGYHFLGRGAFAVDLACSEIQLAVDEGGPGSEFAATAAGVGNPTTGAPSMSPDLLVFTASPTVAPAPPVTPQPVDGSTSSGALPRFHRAGSCLLAWLSRGVCFGDGFKMAVALVSFAAGTFTASIVL